MNGRCTRVHWSRTPCHLGAWTVTPGDISGRFGNPLDPGSGGNNDLQLVGSIRIGWSKCIRKIVHCLYRTRYAYRGRVVEHVRERREMGRGER